ncbi:GGDEF domain-containing protein [Devosia ginsengisoli]|uniref:GGDEF domain-containing protein n=1 Tax=Devosia ginsengisoli TaxID=400770 RepID=UPI0026EA5340|nr:GGDEF domain-containing protein [Devosia ginsengisoli]MCR6671797.1 GGDEF domain-containing protein [Devosia ginsengisoli]
MTEIGRNLPKRAWLRIYRVTGAITLISVVLSVIFTNMIMETFSAGINVQGLAVSILMPLALGGPMIWFLLLKHEQLRHANSQLEHLASTDWLTDCLNRGAFTGAVSRHLDRCAPADPGGALLIVDADDFKSVNDRFGHDAGDEALQLIARAIRKAVRGTDLVGRLGGEEFGVFLAEADVTTADQVAERIRHSISVLAFTPGGTPCPLSVSIGGATYAPGAPFAELYRLADQHLYEAKNTGRDRVAMMQAA